MLIKNITYLLIPPYFYSLKINEIVNRIKIDEEYLNKKMNISAYAEGRPKWTYKPLKKTLKLTLKLYNLGFQLTFDRTITQFTNVNVLLLLLHDNFFV